MSRSNNLIVTKVTKNKCGTYDVAFSDGVNEMTLMDLHYVPKVNYPSMGFKLKYDDIKRGFDCAKNRGGDDFRAWVCYKYYDVTMLASDVNLLLWFFDASVPFVQDGRPLKLPDNYRSALLYYRRQLAKLITECDKVYKRHMDKEFNLKKERKVYYSSGM